jgi:polysaccharide pyruvyl transferase WcaK-like protein
MVINTDAVIDKSFWINLIKCLQSVKKLGVYLIAIDSADDMWSETAAGLGIVFIVENRDWERLQCIIGGLDLVISAKLHGLAAAVDQAVPCYGLAADPKIEGFCLQLDIPYERVTIGHDLLDLSQKIQGFLAEPLEERRRWLPKSDYWKALARENGYILIDYLKRN